MIVIIIIIIIVVIVISYQNFRTRSILVEIKTTINIVGQTIENEILYIV